MINKKIGGLLLLMLLICVGAKAQQTSAMRINEILVVNVDNFVDDYGKHQPWVELYNTSPGTVDLRGCFLTNDKSNPKKYMIPKGDVLTKIAPRQHVVFWLDGQADKGTFHVNFTLDPSRENYLAFYDSDGTTLIDEVTIPAGQRADVSYGLAVDGKGKELTVLPKVTPSTNNVTQDSNEKIENFQNNDPVGIGMTITAMAVVFCGLLILFLVFKQIGKASIRSAQKKAKKAAATGVAVSANAGREAGEIYAAIAMALYEISGDNHDLENTVLTVRKISRRYSPWNSKLYSLRQTPTLKK